MRYNKSVLLCRFFLSSDDEAAKENLKRARAQIKNGDISQAIVQLKDELGLVYKYRNTIREKFFYEVGRAVINFIKGHNIDIFTVEVAYPYEGEPLIYSNGYKVEKYPKELINYLFKDKDDENV